MKKIFVLLISLFTSQLLCAQQTITGTGTIGNIPIYVGIYEIGNSLIVQNANKIGIGTGTPSELLDVIGSIKSSKAIITETNLVFHDQRASPSHNCAINWGAGGSGALYFRTLTAAGNLQNYANRMVLTNAGNLGIGTTSPSEKLEIVHNDATGGIVLHRLQSTSKKSEIKFKANGLQLYAIGNDIDNNGKQTFFIWDQVNTRCPFLINEEGKVSIGGTLAPTGGSSLYQLYV